MTSPTESYLSFFSELSALDPWGLLCLFILAAMRVAPMIVTAPFFGARTPSPIKMGMLITLTILFLPSMTLACKTSLDFNTEFIMLCGKELFIGFLLAFLISIPFYIAQSSGITIDFLRGSSSLQINDPTTQVQASDLGVLYNYLLIVIFYEVNGPFYFYSAMIDSYQIVPPDQWLSLSFFSFHHPVWTQLWDIVNQIMAISIQLAAPSLLAILMTETFLGIANRLAPQVQIAFLGMSLKSLVGLGILCLAWYFILEQMQKHTFLWLEKFYTLVLSLR